MATTTLGAIVALFDADSALADAFAGSGGLWVGGVPEDRLALPQCVIEGFREVPSWDFESGVRQDEGDWTAAIYAAGLEQTEALAAAFLAVFDPRKPAPDGSGGGWVELTALTAGAGATATAAWVVRQDYQVALLAYRTADSSWAYAVRMAFKSYVARVV